MKDSNMNQSKHLILEAERYLQDARKILSERAGKEGNYQNGMSKMDRKMNRTLDNTCETIHTVSDMTATCVMKSCRPVWRKRNFSSTGRSRIMMKPNRMKKPHLFQRTKNFHSPRG
jgi:hypothetical protein